jgi:hypothetical protein
MSEIEFIDNPEYVPYEAVKAQYAELTAKFIERGVYRFYLARMQADLEDLQTKKPANTFAAHLFESEALYKMQYLSNPEAGLAFSTIAFGKVKTVLDGRNFTPKEINEHSANVKRLYADESMRRVIESVALTMYDPTTGRSLMYSKDGVGKYTPANGLELKEDITGAIRNTLEELFLEQTQLSWWPY